MWYNLYNRNLDGYTAINLDGCRSIRIFLNKIRFYYSESMIEISFKNDEYAKTIAQDINDKLRTRGERL